MEIRYAYPSQGLLNRIRKLPYIPEDYELIQTEPVLDLTSRLHSSFGDQLFEDLPRLLRTGKITPPKLSPILESWLEWIDHQYIPVEPSMLSPGAMSNAPDRFDGFHSFNLCCRGHADKGRHRTNLSSYTTDRRVFEHWNEGDWVAADRLMGQIRSQFMTSPCRNNHPGPCAADHIGPLSLGFAHRPEFQLLCRVCNSAKNNRMTFRDVEHLRQAERHGSKVISWYGERLWDNLKDRVDSDETALRLSKILRDNRHNAMLLLNMIAEAGRFTFLLPFLELDRANYNVAFANLRIEDSQTKYDEIIVTPRTTKYAVEQKARRCRIAFQSLQGYANKPSRNALVVSNVQIKEEIEFILRTLASIPPELQAWDKSLGEILDPGFNLDMDGALRQIIEQVPPEQPPSYCIAREAMQRIMGSLADVFSSMWENDRYVRIQYDLSD